MTDTAGLNDLFGGGEQADGTKEYLASLIPAGRVGRPDEIANAVLFLASDEASFVNGVELFVDGGQIQILSELLMVLHYFPLAAAIGRWRRLVLSETPKLNLPNGKGGGWPT